MAADIRQMFIESRGRSNPRGLLDRMFGVTARDEAEAEQRRQEEQILVGMGAAFAQRHQAGAEFVQQYGDEADAIEMQSEAAMIQPLLRMLNSSNEDVRDYAAAELRERDNTMAAIPNRITERLAELQEADQARLDSLTAAELARYEKAEELRRSRTDSYISERTSRLNPINDQLQMLDQVKAVIDVDSPAAVDVARLALAAYINQGRPTDKDAAAFEQLGGFMERRFQDLQGLRGEGAQTAARTELLSLLDAMSRPMYVRAQSTVKELDERRMTEQLFDHQRYDAGFDPSRYRLDALPSASQSGDLETLSLEEVAISAANMGGVGAGAGGAVGAVTGLSRAMQGQTYAAEVAGMNRAELTTAARRANLLAPDQEFPRAGSRAYETLKKELVRSRAVYAGNAVGRGGIAMAAARSLPSMAGGAIRGGLFGMAGGAALGAASEYIGSALQSDVEANREIPPRQPDESLADYTERVRAHMATQQTVLGFPVRNTDEY